MSFLRNTELVYNLRQENLNVTWIKDVPLIPCHGEQNKVQATVWCRSSLLSKCPPVPHGTPAPAQITMSSVHTTHLHSSKVAPWPCAYRKKTVYGFVCWLELPALDPQWRVHPGWDKSRRQATHIQYSQTAWAPQDHSAAEMGPSETEAPNIPAQNIRQIWEIKIRKM